MRLSRRARYALCGVFDLAYNGHGTPIRVQEVGQRQGVPHRFLEQIFRDLRRAGLVEGKRGPGGGFVLARPSDEITLRAVVEAVDGPIARHDEQDAADWTPAAHRPDFVWPDLSERMAGVLGEIRISDLCREAVRRSLKRVLPEGLDYQI
jgi:Rrf2 family iron-sulfur cluster assembly transcriptional regulator